MFDTIKSKAVKWAAVAGAAALALFSASQAFALNTLSGAYIPAGTANNFISDVNTAFIPFLIQLAFQHEIISILVVSAALFIVWLLVRMAWSRFRMRH